MEGRIFFVLITLVIFVEKLDAGTPVRLVDGPHRFAGRLEVFYKGEWGSVCGEYFDADDAHVVCGMITNSTAANRNTTVYSNNYYGSSEGPVWITNLQCNGSEDDLFFCQSNKWERNAYCPSYYQNVALDCNTQVRFQYGNSGLVSIVHNGEWGTVCNQNFGRAEAEVICRTKGLSSRNVTYDWYGYGSGSTYVVDCNGDEDDISDCYVYGGWNYCSHSQDVRLECGQTDIRVVNGINSIQGELELFYNGGWKRVCYDGFGPNEARVACRMLNGTAVAGTIEQKYYSNAYYTGYTVANLKCTGNEEDLSLCQSSNWEHGRCSSQYVVSLDCNTVRLVDGLSKYDGRLEVYTQNGTWGTVCSDGFDYYDASVVCRMLGQPYGVNFYPSGYYPIGHGDIAMTHVDCRGYEQELVDCRHSNYYLYRCSHHQDVGVACGYYTAPNASPTLQTETQIRLVGGGSSYGGRVEVYTNGAWGTICDKNFDYADVQVVCRSLGYYYGSSYGVAYYGAHFGEGQGNIVIEDLECQGHERHLSECRSKTWLSNGCDHSRDVGVICNEYIYSHTTYYAYVGLSNGEYEGSIRLVGGRNSYEGRVEVFYNGQWGTICDNDFDKNEAIVICRALGLYPSSYSVAAYGNAHFGQGSGPILIEGLRCNGNEWGLSQCRSRPWSSHNCAHYEDAGVSCEHYETTEGTTVPTTAPWFYRTTSGYEGQVRLSGGGYYYAGRVEVYSRGQWGTICDDDFDHNDVKVICRMLGLYQGEDYGKAYSNAYYGYGSGPIIVDDLHCNGYESNIKQCSSRPWFENNCGHQEDAGLDCYAYSYDTTSYKHEVTTEATTSFHPSTSDSGYEGQVRLSGGSYYYGRVEVYSRGQWGTICDDLFDHNDVKVICRMLGLYQGENYGRAYNGAYYGSGSGPIIVDNLQCGGYEANIKQCSSSPWYSHDCSHSEDAGLNCYEYYEEATTMFQWWLITSAPRTKLEDAIFVNCDENGWNIVVDMYRLREIYPNAKASDIYLGENTCTGVQSWNTLTFRQGVRECLTSETIRNNVLVYSNQLIYAERDPNYQFIIRFYNWTVGVECDVQRNESSSGHIHHDSSHVTGPDVAGSSHFSVNMSFYSDPNFMYQLQGNPLHVTVGDKVYVKVFTTTTDWTVKMRVHTCYAKPSQFSPDHLKYLLIQNGCEVDTNTHLISQSAHETRFVFQDFEYTSSHEGIHLFCDAVFCGSSDYSRQCQQSCNPVVRRNIAVERINKVSTTDEPVDDNNRVTTKEVLDIVATSSEHESVRNDDSFAETKRVEYEENTSDPTI